MQVINRLWVDSKAETFIEKAPELVNVSILKSQMAKLLFRHFTNLCYLSQPVNDWPGETSGGRTGAEKIGQEILLP